MSVATEIQRIKTAIANAYTAVSGKGGTVPQSAVVGNLATAIGTISTGTPLPTLTNPAAAGDILLHKEAIDGQGSKLTGTLEICDSISVDEVYQPSQGVASMQVASTKDGSMKVITWQEPDALPENIVAGKEILGVTGTYEGGGEATITIVSPTTTCAEIADALRAAVSASITRFIAIRELPHGTNECVAVCWSESTNEISVYRNDSDHGGMMRLGYGNISAAVPQGAVFKIYGWGD